MMTRSNILWGLGGAVVGAIATYFVMEYIYEKEMAEYYGEGSDGHELFSEEDIARHKAAEMYSTTTTDEEATLSVYEKEQNETFVHVVSEEQHMDADEAIVMEAIWMHENGGEEITDLQESDEVEFVVSHDDEEKQDDEDPEQEDEEMREVSVYDEVIYVIDVAEVHPGRRIVARFNHDECSLDISSVMSVKTEELDDHVEERYLEGLLGLEAYNILMNSEPNKKERMIGVRNNVINLDFAISY